MLRWPSRAIPARQWQRGEIATLVSTLMIATYLLYVHVYNKCDMRSILLPLLQVSARHFATVNATYFLDYGSLLGAWRDGGIIPWEYDVDMAVMDEDCGKFLALKDALKKDGLTLYQRGEFVPHKKSILMGYDGYLHKACARIYDQDFKYYIDFDWYRRYTYKEAMKIQAEEEAKGGQFVLPDGYKESDGDVLCNEEAWDGSWPGGCRIYDSVYPLRPLTVLGVQQWIPNNPELNLEQMYGKSWQTPRPKGYKALLCGWLPTSHLNFFVVWMMFSAIPLALYFIIPFIWHIIKTALGRRHHKYSLLPNRTP